jgi:hypothetical protein
MDHLKVTVVPMLEEMGWRFKVTTSDHINVTTDLLVDYGLRLDKTQLLSFWSSNHN